MITRSLGRRKYQFTDGIDARIREIYARRLGKHSSSLPALSHYAVQLGYPKWVLVKRARELGVARIKEKPWSEDELALLERFAHLTPEVITHKLQKLGIGRTRTGVTLKLKRMRFKKNAPYYSATALAECFGIDAHCVTRWIRNGFIRSEMQGSARTAVQGGDVSLIHEKAVRKFVLEHPMQFDLRKVDQLWFLDLITNGKVAS